MSRFASIRWRVGLGVWTVGIWGSRLRNIVGDDDLDGGERAMALAIAFAFVALGVGLLATLRRPSRAGIVLLGALAVAGIIRWSVRGPIILASDEWSVGFKVVHTVLWLVTVALSVAAWRERDTI